ncbi:ATP-binding protein [Terrilactibacillus laevilacticus]|uniref:ATP-binding protein n=1 Tax=Terrilactibacillus laevilacticus TaxID=1380157 RepID=UPI0011463C2A|nr:ATP-binding protein [Terrilactibacillus laevilacticus]
MEYIFLAGIHGVGKSTLAAKLENELNLKSLSISNLIRNAGKNLDSANKRTGDISQNQELWKMELKNLKITEEILLLDGHFCLLDINKNITPLPFTTFAGTDMSKVILMQKNTQTIREQLLKRDNIEYSVDILQKLQENETYQAIKYSEENNIKLFIFNESTDFPELIDFITN